MVSDLHLRSNLQPFYRSFLEFLKEVNQPGDILVLAGDIFDLFKEPVF
jgi:UDP-2,3-diacylglucosamine pyrophosphatase LpxH